MKRTISILLAMGMVVGILSGCGGDAVTQEAAGTPVQQTDEPQIQMDETDGSDDMVTLPDLTESHPIANPPCVMVDGILYQDTGFVDSMVGCGNMDGVIDSAVDATELPSENNQSNFGTGMSYQRSSEGQLIVYVDEEPRIFRDINSTDTTIPEEVLHFTAKVKEVNLLVTYVSTAEGFLELPEGDYVIPKDNLQDEVQVGDTVEIWTNGIILETYPAQIGLAYRIEKVG